MPVSPEQLQGFSHEIKSRWHEISPLDPRSNVAELQRIGSSEFDLKIEHHIGTIGLSGLSCEHHWAKIEDMLVDLSFPVKNPKFRPLLGQYVVVGEMTELKQSLENLPQADYVWPGEPVPSGVKYWGGLVFFERSNTTEWIRYNRRLA